MNGINVLSVERLISINWTKFKYYFLKSNANRNFQYFYLEHYCDICQEYTNWSILGIPYDDGSMQMEKPVHAFCIGHKNSRILLIAFEEDSLICSKTSLLVVDKYGKQNR